MSRVLVRLLERYQEPASRALRAAGRKFDVPLPIAELVAKVEESCSSATTPARGGTSPPR